MRKYAAATALAIALITMLALAVSASLTPANAGVFYCDNVVCVCQSKCRFPYPVRVPLPSQYLACIASCGRTEGVEHLSQSALRARLNASEAARH
jgi:hypothetical protein